MTRAYAALIIGRMSGSQALALSKTQLGKTGLDITRIALDASALGRGWEQIGRLVDASTLSLAIGGPIIAARSSTLGVAAG